MFLFGLTWLFAILTVVSVRGLRETFQIFYTSLTRFRVPLLSCFSACSTRRLEILRDMLFKRRPGCYHHPISLTSTKILMDSTRSTKLNSRSQLFLHHSAQELNPTARFMLHDDSLTSGLSLSLASMIDYLP